MNKLEIAKAIMAAIIIIAAFLAGTILLVSVNYLAAIILASGVSIILKIFVASVTLLLDFSMLYLGLDFLSN